MEKNSKKINYNQATKTAKLRHTYEGKAKQQKRRTKNKKQNPAG